MKKLLLITIMFLFSGIACAQETYTVDLNVKKPVSHFEFSVPDGAHIKSIWVQNNDLMEPNPEVADNVLSVDLVKPVEGASKITIKFDRDADNQIITLINKNPENLAFVETNTSEVLVNNEEDADNAQDIAANKIEKNIDKITTSVETELDKTRTNINKELVKHNIKPLKKVDIKLTDIKTVINKQKQPQKTSNIFIGLGILGLAIYLVIKIKKLRQSRQR